MADMNGTPDASEWRGRTVIGSDGEKIGKLDEIYLDEQTGMMEWATVNTGLFGGKSNFVPLAGAQPSDDDVRVYFTSEQVKGAPSVDADGALSQEQEAELYRHYGVQYSESHSDSGLPAGQTSGSDMGVQPTGHDTSGPTTDDAMTRSEEEVRVGTASRERGRARLRKYVVTEQVQTTVPVQREEVRVEREPITEGNVDAAMDGPAISEEEHEVVLHEEEPVVEKRVVPKERVRMAKETVTDEQTVSEEVRKEEIEAQGEGAR
jgi:uncharacterized protein (TIGR02271 family)